MVDDFVEVFIFVVVRNCGVFVEDVVSQFGVGGVKIGVKVVVFGMVDEVGQFEVVFVFVVKCGMGCIN